MCFNIDENHPNEQIATKDIKCYKVLSVKKALVKSPYFNSCYWRLDNAPKSVTKSSNFGHGFYTIRQGLHSYSTKKFAKKYGCGYTVYNAIIPKGSKYYYNAYENEYVSTQLTVFTTPIN